MHLAAWVVQGLHCSAEEEKVAVQCGGTLSADRIV